GDPLVCIGGPCASNLEPLAPFIDFALIGDAEDAIGEILGTVAEWKRRHGGMATWPAGTRQRLLEHLALNVRGVYVPALYEVGEGNRTPRPKASATAAP